MLIRTHPSMTVLFSARQATLNDLHAPKPTQKASDISDISGGSAVRDLYRYVADLDLLVCGPQYWFYYGEDGRPGTAGYGLPFVAGQKFTLEIALPVQGKIPTALLPYFKRIPAFRCLTSRYEGCWSGLVEEYKRMLAHIDDYQLKMNGIYAESFLHIDFDQPDNQITEIQIGLY
jgi:hypothetical protein